jgi:predicted cupin superfamily sugar epimerase
MIAILPVAFVLYLVFCFIDVRRTEIKKGDFLGKPEIFVLEFFCGLVLTGILYAVTFATFAFIDKNHIKDIDMGGWYINTFKTVEETHKGSKGRTYTTNNIHILAGMNDGSYKVISLPADECSIIQSDARPKAEMYKTVKYNKYFTLVTGFDTMSENVKYVITIPKGSIIENFLAM